MGDREKRSMIVIIMAIIIAQMLAIQFHLEILVSRKLGSNADSHQKGKQIIAPERQIKNICE